MTAITIIFGVLLIFGGISCLFTPLATFLSTGYFLAILLLVYGVGGLIRAIRRKIVPEGIISGLAILVGLLAIIRPGSQLIFDSMLLIFMACWFLLQGILSVVVSIKTRAENKWWGLTLIVGILGILLGLYSFAHPVAAALTAGLLLGFYFLQAGFDLITLGFAASEIKNATGEGSGEP